MDFSRDLLRGSLDMMVLSVLAKGPLYGYLIQKTITASSGEQIKLKAGTLYPVLYRLEEAGAIRSHWKDDRGRERRWYELTEAGRARLEKESANWKAYAETMVKMVKPALAIISPQRPLDPTPKEI